jgi:hypothetical protein
MPTVAEDRSEILQLLHRYSHAFDSGDAEGYADTFVPGGGYTADGVLKFYGRDTLIQHVRDVEPGERHCVLNPVIDVDGDTARVKAYLLLFRGVDLNVVGLYEDQVVRTADGWRFQDRQYTTIGLSAAYQAAFADAFAANDAS